MLSLHSYIVRKQQNLMLNQYDMIDNKIQVTFFIYCDLGLPLSRCLPENIMNEISLR